MLLVGQAAVLLVGQTALLLVGQTALLLLGQTAVLFLGQVRHYSGVTQGQVIRYSDTHYWTLITSSQRC